MLPLFYNILYVDFVPFNELHQSKVNINFKFYWITWCFRLPCILYLKKSFEFVTVFHFPLLLIANCMIDTLKKDFCYNSFSKYFQNKLRSMWSAVHVFCFILLNQIETKNEYPVFTVILFVCVFSNWMWHININFQPIQSKMKGIDEKEQLWMTER